MDAQLEGVVARLHALEKELNFKLVGVNDTYYIGHGDIIISPDQVGVIRNMEENFERKNEFKYFSGYIAPTKPLVTLPKLIEFQNRITSEISYESPKTEFPNIYIDTYYPRRQFGHRGMQKRKLLHYGSVTYTADFGEEWEKIVKIKGQKEEVLERTLVHSGEGLRMVFYPALVLAKAVFDGKAELNVYYFEHMSDSFHVQQPDIEFRFDKKSAA